MKEICLDNRRRAYIINLDPAAEDLPYECDIGIFSIRNFLVDIRDLISLEDAVEELELGPNGGLIFCIEYLSENIEWLEDELSQFDEDGYFLFDCPGRFSFT